MITAAGDNLYDLFVSRFPVDPNRPFIETEEGSAISDGELDRTTGRMARLLAGQRGDAAPRGRQSRRRQSSDAGH